LRRGQQALLPRVRKRHARPARQDRAVAANAPPVNPPVASYEDVLPASPFYAPVEALIRKLDDPDLEKPLDLARTYLLKKALPEACMALAEFDRRAVEAKLDRLLVVSTRIETVAGCR
jgi:hypothetical protein